MVAVLGDFVPPVYPVINHRSGYPFKITQALQGFDALVHSLNILIQPSSQLFDEDRARMINIVNDFQINFSEFSVVDVRNDWRR